MKHRVQRNVELTTDINVSASVTSFWENIEYWLSKNDLSKKDIIGTPVLSLDTKSYGYEDPQNYPVLYATFYTPETDEEFNKRVADEEKLEKLQRERELKEFERLSKKFSAQ